MGKFFLQAVTVVWTLFTVTAFADEPRAIGRILFANKHLWPMKITGPRSRDVVVGDAIYEVDQFETSFRQSLGLEFEDRTKVALGARTKLTLENWNKRDPSGFLVRRIFLGAGLARIAVQKTYSQTEPFIVESPYGAVSVQGTEFVFEVLPKQGAELDVITGRVMFAKTVQALALEEERVLVGAGRKSLVSSQMQKPKTPLQFELAALKRLLAQNKMRFDVVPQTLVERRPASEQNKTSQKRRVREVFRRGGENR